MLQALKGRLREVEVLLRRELRRLQQRFGLGLELEVPWQPDRLKRNVEGGGFQVRFLEALSIFMRGMLVRLWEHLGCF